MDRSLQTLELMAAELGATVMVLRTITLASPPPFPKALFGYENGLYQGGGDQDDPETYADLFDNGAGDDGPPRKGKKKKAPRPPKTKKKPSVFSIADIRGSHDADEPADSIELAPTQTQNFPWRKSDAKMARRGHSGPHGPVELSAQQRKAWGLGRHGESVWDDYGENDSESDGKARPATLDECAQDSVEIADHSISVTTHYELASGADATPIAESWRARNMERALHQDATRWSRKPVLTPEEREEVKQYRKARRKFKKDNGIAYRNEPAEQVGFGAFFPGEESGEDNRQSRSSDADMTSKSAVDDSEIGDGGPQMFAFDTFPSSESVNPPLTTAALAALDADAKQYSEGISGLNGRYGSEEYDYMALKYPEINLNARLPKKQVKKRQVRVKRAEERRLDLLRGDGITAEGMPLTLDLDNPAGATSLMEAAMNDGLSDDGDDLVAIKSVVKRLVEDDENETEDLVDAKARSRDTLPLLSTSPTYTIKPTSPSAQRLFSLPLPSIDGIRHSPYTSSVSAFDCGSVPPSPSDTIIMPLDNLSLSFSHDEVCTAVSPFGSPSRSGSHTHRQYSINDDFPGQTPVAESPTHSQQDNGQQTLSAVATAHVDLANARLCVEALIVKKMDMDDRYLDYSGFIL